MSKFTLDVLETLDYDFTGFPSNQGGQCKGVGTVPEPTQPILDAYTKGVRALFDIREGETSEEVTARLEAELADGGKKAQEEKAKAATEGMISLTAELCQHSPDADELTELPPRVRNAFMKWVHKELANPEV